MAKEAEQKQKTPDNFFIMIGTMPEPKTRHLQDLVQSYTEAEAELEAMDRDHPMWMRQMQVVIQFKNDMLEELGEALKYSKPAPLLV